MEEYANTRLEKKVLAYFLRKDSALSLKLKYFTAPEARSLYSFVLEHKQIADSFDEWWELWSVELEKQNKTLETHKKFLQTLFVEELSEEKIRYWIEQLQAFAEARELYSVYDYSISEYKKGNVKKARKILEDGVNQLQTDFPSDVLERSDFLEGFDERFEFYQEKKRGEAETKMPTGIDKLDNAISGTARASLNFFQGQTNIGKTFLLQEVALSNFKKGERVVFVTVELRRVEIETRWDSRVSGLDYGRMDEGELTSAEELQWKKSIKDLRKYCREGGRLGTAFVPEGCTALTLRNEIEYWERKWNSDVTLLVIDYADLMQSSRKSFSEQESQGNIFKDLKRLSQMKDVVVWTASQVAGRSYGKKFMTLEDTGYSKRKANWANLIIGLSATPDEQVEGILHLFLNKNTYGATGQEVVLYPNFSKGMVDTDQGEEGGKR